MEEKTIAAISTAHGVSGISVIRISGDNAIEVGDKVFRSISGKKLTDMKGYTCAFGSAIYNNQKIDECIASVFRAPFSYTGEDVCELSCHGGIVVTRQVLRSCLENGAVLASAGEFTKRAFLNNKLDLTQAEAVMDIISAKSLSSAKAAIEIKDGALSKKVNEIRDKMVFLAAHLEAWADYPEEDIPEIESKKLEDDLNTTLSEIQKLLSTYDNGQIIKNGISAAIVGKPNVGKSTLMNLLSGYEKSIVTDIPGTTRDIVEETIALDDLVINLADTAGIHDTDERVEKIGVDKAIRKTEQADIVIAIFDSSSPLSDEDRNILSRCNKENTLVVINKTDLGDIIDKDIFKGYKTISVSAKNNEGTEELIALIKEFALDNNFDESGAIIYNERQRTLVRKAEEELLSALSALKGGYTYDAVTIDIESAISALLELTGERVTEKVVDNVFHNFCVGK